MTKGFLHKIYRNWMSANFDRFQYSPKIIKQSSHYIEVQFEGLLSNISFCLRTHKGFVTAEIRYQSDYFEWFDIAVDFDMVEKRTQVGRYYCDQCIESNDYPTREALWIEHIFEPLLQWINSISAETVAAEQGTAPEGSWAVRICNQDEIDSSRYKFIHYLEIDN